MSLPPVSLRETFLRLISMLFVRPLHAVVLLVLVALVTFEPRSFGGFRDPLARRLTKPPSCAKQVSQEQDFGMGRLNGSRRRPRC